MKRFGASRNDVKQNLYEETKQTVKKPELEASFKKRFERTPDLMDSYFFIRSEDFDAHDDERNPVLAKKTRQHANETTTNEEHENSDEGTQDSFAVIGSPQKTKKVDGQSPGRSPHRIKFPWQRSYSSPNVLKDPPVSGS